ncbi:tyrosine-type recombinase/integrase [Nocardiopsis sp. NRRL B-16309]|uniref:tyrosine-type recombinase/integrase n=1 Tax=Nocardiopsis sp. NRRL B-16309 TaxID=1519494 RepID=UPI0009E6A55E|nr:tyrosine-type recombinase/integrase [Nocardiopsis sp. NRRL B-16309]
MGRRANGEGTIYQRVDGRYEAAIMLPTSSGTRKRFRVYGKTRQEAHKKLTRIVEEVRRGILPPEQAWKVGEYLDFWLEREKRRPLTRKRHETIARLYIKPGLGRHRLDGLSVRIVQNFLDDLLAGGKSVATIHQVRKVLSAALTYAMRQEMIMRNVARLVELPRYKPKEAQHWTPDEIVRFLKAAESDSLYPVFTLLTLYGLRRGEVLGIRWRDVDFDHGVLHIRQQVQRINGKLEQVELKTDSSKRDEPLLEKARDILLDQRRIQEEAKAEAGSDWQGSGGDDELVFTTRTGRPLEARNLERSFMRICKQHGLRRITVHGLRHSNATTQKGLQVHSRDIQAILGHGDVRTTGIYEHVDLASKRNALRKVEARLFAAAANRGRSRQNYRQTTSASGSNISKSQERKAPTPDGLGAFLGSSDRDRTCDLRLMSTIEATLEERLTSVKQAMQRRTRIWLLGCITVSICRQQNPQTPAH